MEQIRVEKTASRGIVVEKVYMYLEPDLTPATGTIADDQVQAEIEKFEAAKNAVVEELGQLAEKNEIFAAHLEIANDFMLQDGVESKKDSKSNVEQAISNTIDEFAMIFASMDDEYMKERAADVRDIGKRMMAVVKGVKLPDLGVLTEPVVVMAKDMYPSDTVKINPALVKGIVTEEGGVTSHVSIIAKSLGIPTLVGVKGILSKVDDGEYICMDAGEGIIVVKPDEDTEKEYLDKKAAYEQERARLEGLRSTPAVTKDGKRIYLCANVGNVQDIRNALPMNIDGVGLFRSEFLYMQNTHFPTEEEQFVVYKEAAELASQELTIRTLDIGGDKELSYYEFEKDTYEIDEFDCSSIFLFVGKERALLLDTGCGIGDLKGVIRKITDKPYIVIASHGHMDHIGGAGAFDELYINPADNYFLDVSFEKMLENRRNYADFIREREDKYYPYSTEKDMLCWEKKPKLLPLSDGQTFDLGGRIITAYSCPGHTPGEMIFIDSKTRYLFCADACNRNLLLMQSGDHTEGRYVSVEKAAKAMERIVSMKDQYDHVINSHHDYRGFGAPLADYVVDQALECMKKIVDGTAEIREIPDPLQLNATKTVAVYGDVFITYSKEGVYETR